MHFIRIRIYIMKRNFVFLLSLIFCAQIASASKKRVFEPDEKAEEQAKKWKGMERSLVAAELKKHTSQDQKQAWEILDRMELNRDELAELLKLAFRSDLKKYG